MLHVSVSTGQEHVWNNKKVFAGEGIFKVWRIRQNTEQHSFDCQ